MKTSKGGLWIIAVCLMMCWCFIAKATAPRFIKPWAKPNSGRCVISWSENAQSPRACFFPYGQYSQADAALYRMLGNFWTRNYFDSIRTDSPTILLIDDHPDTVDGLREAGLKAWAVSPFSSVSEWMFQGATEKLPVRIWSVHIVARMSPLFHVDDLLEMMRVLKPQGFLVVDIRFVPSVDRTLKRVGYESLPFTWRGLSIYRKAA